LRERGSAKEGRCERRRGAYVVIVEIVDGERGRLGRRRRRHRKPSGSFAEKD